jgi:NAD(P)-dependent dehydrogenase (short-subunit alcohol dehydrogenase family)
MPMERRRSDPSETPLTDLLSLTGLVAVVTGGGRGIGAACCERLAEAGAAVAVADLDGPSAEAVAARLGGGARGFAVDVADVEAVRSLRERTVAGLGGLDIWVNAAGIYSATPLLDLGEAEWNRVLDVNLRGTFLGAQEAARAMIAQGSGGVIVNISSTAAYAAAGTGVAHYAASKFGVRGLTKSLAVELGPHGIRVLGVAPTVTITPGLEERRAELEAQGFLLEELAESLPLGRVAVPDDVARVVVFCAGGLSALMTGTTLVVDAGELTR